MEKNINKLEYDITDHMTVGFEVLFPILLEMAQELQIELPYDAPILQDIYAQRKLKLSKYYNCFNNLCVHTLLKYKFLSDLDVYFTNICL